MISLYAGSAHFSATGTAKHGVTAGVWADINVHPGTSFEGMYGTRFLPGADLEFPWKVAAKGVHGDLVLRVGVFGLRTAARAAIYEASIGLRF